jgi:hypothetical protein
MKYLVAALLTLLPITAFAQGSVLQAGQSTGGHAPMYVRGGGYGQTVIQDSGPASGGAAGLGLSEFLQVNRSASSGSGSGPLGTHDCNYSAPTTSSGYYYLCFDAYASGGGLLAYGNAGTAPALPFTMSVNGSTYQFPFVLSGIVGPSTSTVGHLATWANTFGTQLQDSGTVTNDVIFSGAGTGLTVTNNASVGGLTSKGNILDTLTATSAPSSVCSTASFSVAFSCDLTYQPIAAGLNITGTATLTEPTSGYAITPNLSSYLTYFTNASGWNNSTSSNSGRTGAWAFNSTAISLGQGDTGIYYCNGLINSAKVGATSFLAGPSVDCMAGQITAAQAHGYIELLGDLNCTDNGYDSACIGMVENFTRTVNTAAQGETWIGQRLQSKGADAIDAFASWTGPSVIGLDVTSATFTTNAAAAIPAGVGIFLNSVAGGGNNFPAQTSVGTSEIYYSSGLSAIVIQPQGNASLQVSSSGVAVSTTNGLRATSPASAAGTQIGYAAGAYVEGLTSSSTPAALSINPSGGAVSVNGNANTGGQNSFSVYNSGTLSNAGTVATMQTYLSASVNTFFAMNSFGGASPTSQLSSGSGNTGGIVIQSLAGPINFAPTTTLQINGAAGVTCAGAPTGAFASTNGIVTHC